MKTNALIFLKKIYNMEISNYHIKIVLRAIHKHAVEITLCLVSVHLPFNHLLVMMQLFSHEINIICINTVWINSRWYEVQFSRIHCLLVLLLLFREAIYQAFWYQIFSCDNDVYTKSFQLFFYQFDIAISDFALAISCVMTFKPVSSPPIYSF